MNNWYKISQTSDLPQEEIDDLFTDSHDITEEEVESIIGAPDTEEPEPEWVSFTAGTTPDNIIRERTLAQDPDGYPMLIRSPEEWGPIVRAVNHGIDAHLEAMTRSTFNDDGHCLVHPEEMATFLRRLSENGDEEGDSLRSSILSTLNIEEI